MSTKRKLPSKLAAPVVRHAARTPSKQILSEARAVVSSGGAMDSPSVQLNGDVDTIEISSDPSSSEDENDDNELLSHNHPAEKDAVAEAEAETAANHNNNDHDDDNDTSMADAAPEPSFGDLVLAHPEPISVTAAFPTSSFPTTAHAAAALPPGASLGVALTQALKTTDHALLESCLQTPDLPTIRATIQRLASPLAATLLGLLATRLHRRPGRAGSLMVWIQWTLVVHGGYLATQPVVVGKLAELNRVVAERARGLQGLLVLKGKLDLLDAQMQVRKSVREGRRGEEEEDEDDDEGIVYVEGEEEEEEGESEADAMVLGNGRKSKKVKRSQEFEDSESEMSDEMPDTLGDRTIADSDDEEDSDEDNSDDEGGLLDDEAEETDDDSGDDEEEVDFDDADEDEEDSDPDAAPIPSARSSKMAKLNGMFGKSR